MLGEILKRLPGKELKASGILSARQHVLHWGSIKQIYIWWRKLSLPPAWIISWHTRGRQVRGGGRCGTSHCFL